MNTRTTIGAAAAAILLITGAGCAVTRDQQSVGSYVDDSAITSSVKARFVENTAVDAAAISVETLKGTVMLSGFAKNPVERTTAETIAMKVPGVVGVKNQIVVRP
jgi:hyperosmotically inducible periplasmic protein